MESFFWGIDRIFVAILLSPSDLGYFHIAHTFAKGVMMFYVAITALLYPKMITMFTLEDRNKNILDNNMTYIIKFTESFLILAIITSSIIIPLFIKYFVPAYSGVGGLFFIISLGLLLKGLFFYPSTYFIAVDKQKWLMLISVGFLCLLCCCYLLATPLFQFTPVSFTSIAVSVFFCFLAIVSYYYFKNNQTELTRFDVIKKIFFLYYKLFITCFFSVVLLNIDNFSLYIDNLHILIFLILILYFNNMIKYTRDFVILGIDYSKEFLKKKLN